MSSTQNTDILPTNQVSLLGLINYKKNFLVKKEKSFQLDKLVGWLIPRHLIHYANDAACLSMPLALHALWDYCDRKQTYFAFMACSLKYISLLLVNRSCMNPAGPIPVGQSTALKLISHNPLPLCGGRRARSPEDFKDQDILFRFYEKIIW